MIQSILSKVFGRDVPVRCVGSSIVEPGLRSTWSVRCAAEKAAAYVNMWAGSKVMPGGSPHPNVLRAVRTGSG